MKFEGGFYSAMKENVASRVALKGLFSSAWIVTPFLDTSPQVFGENKCNILRGGLRCFGVYTFAWYQTLGQECQMRWIQLLGQFGHGIPDMSLGLHLLGLSKYDTKLRVTARKIKNI